MNHARSFARSIIDAVADALCAVPEWVPRGVIVLVLMGASWGAVLWPAMMILKALKGLPQ